MELEPRTLEFDVTLEDLVEAGGLEGLNEILDQRMSQRPEFEGMIATDISYEAVSVSPGDVNLIVIVATFTPDPLYAEDEDELGSFESEEGE